MSKPRGTGRAADLWGSGGERGDGRGDESLRWRWKRKAHPRIIQMDVRDKAFPGGTASTPAPPPPEPSGARASLMGIGQEVGMQGLGLHMLTVAIVVCGSHGF